MLALSRHSPEAAARDIADVQSRTAHPVGVTLLVEFLQEPLLACGRRAGAGRRAVLGMARPGARPRGERRGVAGRARSTKPRPRSTPDVASSSRRASKPAGTCEAPRHSPSSSPWCGPRSTCPSSPPAASARAPTSSERSCSAPTRCASAPGSSPRIESAAHPVYVDLLSAATGADTELTETLRGRLARRSASGALVLRGGGARGHRDPVATVQSVDGTTIPFVRFSTAPPTADMTGDIRAMALYAGTGVDAVRGRVAAADIVAELTEGLEDRVTERVVITGANRGLGLELARQHSEARRRGVGWMPPPRRRNRAAWPHEPRRAGRHGIGGLDPAGSRMRSAPRRSTSSTTTPASTPGPSGSTTAPVTCCS